MRLMLASLLILAFPSKKCVENIAIMAVSFKRVSVGIVPYPSVGTPGESWL